MKIRKGYKILSSDMKDDKLENGREYVLGKDMKLKGFKERFLFPFVGFHYLKSIEGAIALYDNVNGRFFEIEDFGTLDYIKGFFVTNKIRLVKELSKEDINKYFTDNFEEFIKSDNTNVRYSLAKLGLGLDVLINDKDAVVRHAVAKQGYGHEQLVKDKDWIVRIAIAERGCYLNELLNDESWRIRMTLARRGYGLDKLINDNDWRVRLMVADQCYGLETLVNDKNKNVRKVAMRNLI